MRKYSLLFVICAVCGFLLPAGQALAANTPCDNDKASLAKIDQAISALNAAQAPAKLANDLIGIIDTLSDGLKGTKGDIGKITGPVKAAQDKLKTLTDDMKAVKEVVPPSVSGLKSALDSFSKQIDAGAKAYKASAPGKVASGLSDASGYIGTITDKLDGIRAALVKYKAMDDAMNGTGADQVRGLKLVIDEIASHTEADKVPGVGDFLKAYSTALDGIATSVNSLETTLKDRLKMANAALQGTDFGNLDNLYPGLQTENEKRDATLAALKQERDALAGRIEEQGCNKPLPPPDPCKDAAATQNLADGMTAKQLAAYQNAQNAFDGSLRALMNNAMLQPQAPVPSAADADVAAAQVVLASLSANAGSGYVTVYAADAGVQSVRALGGTVSGGGVQINMSPTPAGQGGNLLDRVKSQIIPALTKAIATRQQAAQSTDAAAKAKYDAAAKNWQATNSKLVATAKAALGKLNSAKAAYQKAMGDSLAQEASAKNWSADQQKTFDECFPPQGALRRASQTRFPVGPKTVTGGANAAAPKTNCKPQGGLAGMIENEACQIQNSGH